ncbi:MAG: GntR family transcriptional regulator [Clostridiaceae bacterium]|nr:GntR family transcriptional regulator [Clostridiaceae bacterium]
MGTKASNISEIYDILRDRILTCCYQPGQLIFEKDIVSEFQVSRTPIREVLNILNGEGLVKMIPKKGIMISHLSIKTAKQINEIRRILEPLVINQAVNNIKAYDIEYLSSLDNILRNSFDSNKAMDVFDHGMDIYIYITNLTKNETLISTLKWLREESYRVCIYYFNQFMDVSTDAEIEEVREKIINIHIKIVEALKEKSEQEAIRYMIMDIDTFNLYARNY